MSQHDFDIANQTAPSFRSDLNDALAALASLSSGATAPSTTYANMLWYDTANNLLKMRNESDSAWITIGTLNQFTNKFEVDNLPTLTQATWEAGTSTTEAVVTPAKVKAAIESIGEKVTTTTVNTAIASSSVGAVGTYALLGAANAITVAPGLTSPGSALSYAGFTENTSDTNTNLAVLTGSPSGTWRCMGYYNTLAGLSVGHFTLWLRIS
jgi:hypothetical protein